MLAQGVRSGTGVQLVSHAPEWYGDMWQNAPGLVNHIGHIGKPIKHPPRRIVVFLASDCQRARAPVHVHVGLWLQPRPVAGVARITARQHVSVPFNKEAQAAMRWIGRTEKIVGGARHYLRTDIVSSSRWRAAPGSTASRTIDSTRIASASMPPSIPPSKPAEGSSSVAGGCQRDSCVREL